MTRNIYWKFICLNLKKQSGSLLIFILLVSFKSGAQNKPIDKKHQFYKIISFDEKIDFGQIDHSTTWIITNSINKNSTTLQGNEINNYVFREPGEYQINFQEDKNHVEQCHHPIFEAQFLVKAEPIKILFDFSKITFSEKIEKGKNYSDLIVSVPVKISTKDNSIKKRSAPGLSIAGIGVLLKAQPVQNEIILSDSIQLLKYKISGRIDKETYLMFDFYDFNNEAQTFNLLQIIK